MSNSKENTPEIVAEETLYHGAIFNLNKVSLKLPDGKLMEREVIVHHGSVGILPITEDGKFLLVKQYRAPAGRSLLEVPAGTLEAGEDPRECALRELAEEVGQTAAVMRPLAGFYLAPGWATEFMHSFIATGLSPQFAEGDEDEDIEVVELSPEEALQAIFNGELIDCKSLAMIGLYFAEKWMQHPTSTT